MRVLVDTNVLLRTVQPEHGHHATAKSALARLGSAGARFVLVPQVLYEFWVVATRPTNSNGLGFKPDRAAADCAEFKRAFQLLRDERAIFDEWESLVQTHAVRGKQAHDARIAAAMSRHGLGHILTFNVQDFARFPSIAAIDPMDPAGVSHRGPA